MQDEDLCDLRLEDEDPPIASPAKRIRLSTNPNQPATPPRSPPSTQASQAPSPLRRIPGPAGTLPPLLTSEVSGQPIPLVDTSKDEDGLLLIHSKLHKKMSSSIDGNDSDFTRGSWVVMLKAQCLPPFGIILLLWVCIC